MIALIGSPSSLASRHHVCRKTRSVPPPRNRQGGRFVIRDDHRDTGRSITYAPGAPEYTGDDLVADAAGVLDALGVGRAHVVGMSMGGGIAQLLALDYPDRVWSLTLISTSPGSGPGLPATSDELRAYFAEPPPQPDWSDRDAVIDYLVEGERV